jgi:hypothetical protein
VQRPWLIPKAALCCLILFAGHLLPKSRPARSAAPLAAIPLEPYLRAQAVARAIVNGQSGTFLFDTGEGVSSFSPAFAEKTGCRPWGRISGFRMSGERLDNKHCDNITTRLARPIATRLSSARRSRDIQEHITQNESKCFLLSATAYTWLSATVLSERDARAATVATNQA